VLLDVFDTRTTLADWLVTRGFRAQRPLFRMRRKRGVPVACPAPAPLAEFAIVGPEFG
jgi:hypothetical protein